MQAAKRSFRAPGRWSSVTTATLALHSCPCFYSVKQWHTYYLLSGESIKLFLLQIRMPVMQNLSLCNISCLYWSSISQAYQSWTPGLKRWQIAQVQLCWTELTHKQGKLAHAYLHTIKTRSFLRASTSTCILNWTCGAGVSSGLQRYSQLASSHSWAWQEYERPREKLVTFQYCVQRWDD